LKLNDAVFGALFLALSLLVLWTVRGYPTIPGQHFGPAAFPGLVAAVLAACSLLLIVQGVRARRKVPWLQLGAWLRSPPQLAAFTVAVCSLVLYVVAAERLGFLPTGVVMLAALMRALGVRWPKALVVAVLATLAIHVAFYKGLRVPLPWGVLPVLY
jgi:putative tricarboxylic transport membrane protein